MVDVVGAAASGPFITDEALLPKIARKPVYGDLRDHDVRMVDRLRPS